MVSSTILGTLVSTAVILNVSIRYLNRLRLRDAGHDDDIGSESC